VGRQGSFPFGIDIIKLADYFTLSSRKNAYVTISVELAKVTGKVLLIAHDRTHCARHRTAQTSPVVARLGRTGSISDQWWTTCSGSRCRTGIGI
jgi:hypothetical protein